MSDLSRVSIVLGTRPEIIKLAPVIRALDDATVPYSIIHTGQHYSDELNSVFFDRLDLPRPDITLDIGSGSHGEQTGEMISAVEGVLEDTDPEWVLVQGDTNSVLAGGIASSKLDVSLGHIEAGLRSYDRSMPEEVNRVLTDHAADHLFAPTQTAADNLAAEGIKERITVTGNTVVDAVQAHVDIADQKSDVLQELSLCTGEYAVLTAHRAENVDEESRFQSILDGLEDAASKFDIPVIYPIHPRAADRINAFDIEVPGRVQLVDPLAYLDFLQLQRNAAIIVTDSGGVQEEACILGTPCVTVRDNTERPETLDVGANELVGTDHSSIVAGVESMLGTSDSWLNPFGDGNAAERILDVILNGGPAKDCATCV